MLEDARVGRFFRWPNPARAQPSSYMTDFGTANDAVAICKAVMISIAPDARIMDITHGVTPFRIEEGARFLEAVSPYYPAGTFSLRSSTRRRHSRKAIIVKTKRRQYFRPPDNGLITPVIDRDGLDSAREITNQSWMIQAAISSTFHGRDIFSPAAAHLAAGWDFNMVGPWFPNSFALLLKPPPPPTKASMAISLPSDDPFGSLVTDIPGGEFKKLGYSLGDKFRIEINKKPVTVPYVKTSWTSAWATCSFSSIPATASASPSTKATTTKKFGRRAFRHHLHLTQRRTHTRTNSGPWRPSHDLIPLWPSKRLLSPFLIISGALNTFRRRPILSGTSPVP